VRHSWITVDGNEAAASVAYRLSEVIAIYPITPASPMGEAADAWSAEHVPNIWGAVPRVVELQSEAGAAGAVHGALQAGALATTFTASQGLLLMLPNMYKIAGELTPAVIHVAARAVATHALSIFGDHSDVMAARSTGWAMLCASSVQEAHDFALIAHAATLDTRIPFLHFFDGFRTSHEIARIASLSDGDLEAVVDARKVGEHRARALTPDRPVVRGTAQNPDVFFQGREAANPYYEACPSRVQRTFDRFAHVTGRHYQLFDYVGPADAERVIVVMGSAAGAVAETVAALRAAGERVGLLKVRLFRPFSAAHLLTALPKTVRGIAVLDRTKEAGAAGEPLYQDVVTALAEARATGESPFERTPRVISGRYGLGSKEFTPAMAKAVFDELTWPEPAARFSIGVEDDVTFHSLRYDGRFTTEPDDVVRALFYGLGSDGTVGANKNSIKIIAEATGAFAQAYFVYDSKKSGSTTVSHLRFGPRPIESTYLIQRAQFVACHNWELLTRIDVLEHAADGATLLLNAPYDACDVWAHLPASVRNQIVARNLEVYAINAAAVAAASGMGRHVNTILQVCFFAISKVMPLDRALAAVKEAVRHTYASKGEAVVQKNLDAVDQALAHLRQIDVPQELAVGPESQADALAFAPAFVRQAIGPMIAGNGDAIPVSLIPADGTYPTGTSQWEKRNLADDIPVWDEHLCIQCGKCAFVCPHAAIRIKAYGPACLADAPTTFKSADYRGAEYAGQKYTIQVAPEDCTGCRLCVDVCPARDKTSGALALEMRPQRPLRDAERTNYEFFLKLPEVDRRAVKTYSVKGSQFLQPLFEYSGACVGCGETPYLKLASQLFGDRMIVANATGCSSIFGGNLPTTPWTCNSEGRGPAWCNSLFEDNAEFGYGMRIAVEARAAEARDLVARLRGVLDDALVDALLAASQATEADIYEQRQRVLTVRRTLEWFLLTSRDHDARASAARRLLECADYLVKKSVWLVGGDGWAYDIGYGGLDHVLASGANVNVLVLDTEVYSNTGGQASKATPRGAVARFAASGKPAAKKDLGLLALTYRNVYVARVALGANDTQTVKAFLEAESYDGPSLIIAYAHCIAHGVDMSQGLQQQSRAVASGHWPLFRYDPRRAAQGAPPFVLDSKAPSLEFKEFAAAETRFRRLTDPDAAALTAAAQQDIADRWQVYQAFARAAPNLAEIAKLHRTSE
jgi:pyruvate-ferredoxin/flavodoxin oxidoreductase